LQTRRRRQEPALGPAFRWAGLRAAMSQLGMSARAFHRILKLVRTVGDLEGMAEIKTHHLAEAIRYRRQRQT
jgi:magnesium chelatase family protein